ncbi:MAG: hypothetical protein M3Y91_17210, partial [Actinomycetota bacterium]|nr:hypothetical protein [Actinomycetota bacterium]
MDGKREELEDLGVSIRWPKGYEDDDASIGGPSRRARKASADERRAPRRSPRRPTAPAADVEPIEVKPPDQAPTGEESELSERVDRLSDSLTAVTEQITKALSASDDAVRRVERLCSALSVEVAEVGQAISDQVARYSSATTEGPAGKRTSPGKGAGASESVTPALTRITQKLDGLATAQERAAKERRISESVTPALTRITQKLDGLAAAVADASERPGASPLGEFEDLMEGTAEAVTRIETLTEALIEASDARPADISELSVRTLERLGLTVGARFEANTTTAVEAIDKTVNEALDRAVAQFKEVAPPLVDRSTTAAITRL